MCVIKKSTSDVIKLGRHPPLSPVAEAAAAAVVVVLMALLATVRVMRRCCLAPIVAEEPLANWDGIIINAGFGGCCVI